MSERVHIEAFQQHVLFFFEGSMCSMWLGTYLAQWLYGKSLDLDPNVHIGY